MEQISLKLFLKQMGFGGDPKIEKLCETGIHLGLSPLWVMNVTVNASRDPYRQLTSVYFPGLCWGSCCSVGLGLKFEDSLWMRKTRLLKSLTFLVTHVWEYSPQCWDARDSSAVSFNVSSLLKAVILQQCAAQEEKRLPQRMWMWSVTLNLWGCFLLFSRGSVCDLFGER